MDYNSTCDSADAPSFSKSTQSEFILFVQADGVQAGIDYVCYVTMTVTAYNGTNLDNNTQGEIETQTSPKSEEATVTTLEGKGRYMLETVTQWIRFPPSGIGIDVILIARVHGTCLSPEISEKGSIGRKNGLMLLLHPNLNAWGSPNNYYLDILMGLCGQFVGSVQWKVPQWKMTATTAKKLSKRCE